MKFLIALSVLASSSVFANIDGDRYIKCYEVDQGDRELEYVLEEKGGYLWLKHPFKAQLELNQERCLETKYGVDPVSMMGRDLELCRGDGQRINGLIPVEAEEHYDQQEEERTVYCEKELKRWFYPRAEM